MASLSISSIGKTSCYCTISGLSLDYNLTNYMEVGVTTSSFTNGTSSRPSGIKGTEVPTSSGTLRYADFSAFGFSAGTTYTLYAFARTLDGNYWSAGSKSFTTDDDPPPPPPKPSKPYNFYDSTNEHTTTIHWTNGATYDLLEYWFLDLNYTMAGATTDKYFNGLSSDTYYVFYLRGRRDGVWSDVADYTIHTDAESTRPSNWTAFSGLTSGASMGTYNGKPSPTTASNWNSFFQRINAFRTYKNLTSYPYTVVSSGGVVGKTNINQARLAINDMSPSTAIPSEVFVGTEIGQQFYQLQQSLNSIN